MLEVSRTAWFGPVYDPDDLQSEATSPDAKSGRSNYSISTRTKGGQSVLTVLMQQPSFMPKSKPKLFARRHLGSHSCGSRAIFRPPRTSFEPQRSYLDFITKHDFSIKIMPKVFAFPNAPHVKTADTWDLSSLCESDARWEELFQKLDKQIARYEKFRGKLGGRQSPGGAA